MPAQKKNIKRDIVVILCDQLRCDFLSLYGCRGVPTPNLDCLVRQGVVFDRAITASPVCSPAHASMMTGLYPTRHGVWKNDLPYNPGLDYLTERMNALGYHTGAFGKLHHTSALAASLPNCGAVKGFKDRTVLEYSFTLDRDGVYPDADLEVPDCFHGLMSTLATHQTLLGDAIATGDPRLFAQVLYAYPLHQNEPETRALWKELLEIHAAEMPAVFQEAKDYC